MLLLLTRLSEGTVGMFVVSRFQQIQQCEGRMDLRGWNRIELNRIESTDGFVDCGIVSRSSLEWRMIGRMYV